MKSYCAFDDGGCEEWNAITTTTKNQRKREKEREKNECTYTQPAYEQVFKHSNQRLGNRKPKHKRKLHSVVTVRMMSEMGGFAHENDCSPQNNYYLKPG